VVLSSTQNPKDAAVNKNGIVFQQDGRIFLQYAHFKNKR
jgi:hypothetical protein